MHQTQSFAMAALTGLLALGTACSGSDETDTGVTPNDAGTVPYDGGVVDTGVRFDSGVRDVGVRDAGLYCTSNNAVAFDEETIPVDPATALTQNSNDRPGVLSCIDSPPRPAAMPFEYCLTECAEFFGYRPSAAEVAALEIAVFAERDGQSRLIDPTFDPVTGMNRSTPLRVNGRFLASTDCASGYQLELGYNDLGSRDTMYAEQAYVVRVRSATTAVDAWVPTYQVNFIRRNDEVPGSSACALPDNRIPSRGYTMPVMPRSLIESAVARAGAAVPGSDDLSDGRGNGYVLVETRDCAAGGGITISGVTAGTSPRPIGSVYLDPNFAFRSDRDTSVAGLYLATGFTGVSATESAAVEVHAAVGALRYEGACTEELGAQAIRVFPDSLTFWRTNRETVIHGRE